MKKNLIILILSLAIVISLFIVIFLSIIDNNENDLFLAESTINNSIILFTGDTCEHCRDVENYIYDNNLLNNLDLSIKEVYYNIDNALLFEEMFDQCLFQPRTYGVPLLWHNRNCILGPLEIISYLNNL